MATEVSCGHCQGRLLIETRGVVVACPHCGTHLSIPALDPVPAAQQPVPTAQEQLVPPSPNVTPVTLDPPAPLVDVPTPGFTPPPEPVPIDTAPFPVITDFAERQIPPVDTTATAANQELSAGPEDQSTDSVHLQPDEPVNPDQIGWHSAPNLSLGPEIPRTSLDNPDDNQTQIMEPTHQPQAGEWSPVLGGDPTVVLPSVPVGSGDVHISSTQQFSLAALANEAAKSNPTTVPSAVPPQSVPVFAAAPATSPPGPLTFGAPPAASAPPVTFGAALASAPTSNPFSFGPAAAPDSPAAAPSPFPVFSAAPATAGLVAPAPAPVALPDTTVTQEVAGFVENESASRQKFLFLLLIIVGSYASAVTIVLVYMLIRGQASALESLPDLVPVVGKNGELSWTYSPPMNDVAPGHVLELGQSRRFGNVKVTPLKVTRGIVQFEHYSGEARLARNPTEPVLKLWVRFENVSRDQTFAPLDPHVLFKRNSINLGQKIQANAFVTREAERKKGKSLFYIFDMPVLSEFRMVGQNLNRSLEPGESVETFIPSEEEARDLNGDLVWRFQFRKGYHPTSKRGVTTLIDVRFNSDQITDERKA
jgi:hypothetical protein